MIRRFLLNIRKYDSKPIIPNESCIYENHLNKTNTKNDIHIFMKFNYHSILYS